MTRSTRRWLWVVGTVAVIIGAGPMLIRYVAGRLLEGEEFRRFINAMVGGTLKAEAETGPFHFRGGQLMTEGLRAHGTSEAWFSRLEARDVKAEVSLRRLIFGPRGLDGLHIAEADLQLDGPHKSGPPAPPAPSKEKVELGVVKVDRARMGWKGGSLSKVVLQIAEDNGMWIYKGTGGRLDQAQVPPLEVNAFELRQRGQRLTIENGQLAMGESGTVALTGDINWEKGVNLDLLLKLAGIPVERLPVPTGWDNRLTGLLAGDVTVTGAVDNGAMPEFKGRLQMSEARLATQRFFQALPFMSLMPEATKPEKVALSRAECRFTYKGGRLEVRDLIMESAGIMKLGRLDGDFTVENGIIKGDFKLGVPEMFHRLAPTVFSRPVGGYAWAPMHVEGPVENPKNDLSERATAALSGAANTLLEGLANPLEAARNAADLLQGKTPPVQDAVKQGADFLRGVLGGDGR